MNGLRSWLSGFSFCLLSIVAVAECARAADCASGQCASPGLRQSPTIPESRPDSYPTGRYGQPVQLSSNVVVEQRRNVYPTYGRVQYERCAPGECYLFYELVDCTQNEFTCKDGSRRVWSYRPLYYPVDNSELIINLDKKLCPTAKSCKWPYTRRDLY